MKKIISLFQRNYETDRLVRDEITPGAEWVQAGEGIATEKIDGTCCMIKDGKLYKRYELKKGKTANPLFVPAQDPDPITGDVPGWLPVNPTAKEDQWHQEAFETLNRLEDGTYELIGKKVQGNKYNLQHHELVKHGKHVMQNVPTKFEDLKSWLLNRHNLEGIVWHHPDGRMVKIKAKDFGIKW